MQRYSVKRVATTTLRLHGLDSVIHNVNMNTKRGRTVVAPNKTELRRYLERGLTQQQIADEWEKDSGYRVSRSTIGMAIARYGLESSRPRLRYEDLLPWHVAQQHLMAYDARMLRYEGRRRAGLEVDSDTITRLEGWIRDLRSRDAVVHYDPDTAEGFYWVKRSEEDDDLIRRPAGV